MLNYFNPIKNKTFTIELKDGNRTKLKTIEEFLRKGLNQNYDMITEKRDTGHVKKTGRKKLTAYDIWCGKELALVVKIIECYETSESDLTDQELKPELNIRLYDPKLKDLYKLIKTHFKID
ncbi:MAG: hypothetical protein AABY22_24160 [Nanoarchaeota archaeon]